MLAIVYHSQSGRCAQLAQAAAEGAQKRTEVKVYRAVDVDTQVWLQHKGVLLIAAENSAALAGDFKAFLDRTLYPFHRTGGVVPAALLINAGNDGSGAVKQFERIARGFPLRLMVPSTIIVGPIGAAERGRAHEWGEGLAEGVSLGIF